MLIELYGENFGCFRDEFQLSMLATDVDPHNDRGVATVELEGDDEPLRLLRAVAIYGANASGKSTVLYAAQVLRQLISGTSRMRSDSPLDLYEPFALGTKKKEPVRLGIKAVIDRRIYDYEIQFDRTKFVSERLVWLKPNGKSSVLINRTGQKVEGEWEKDERFKLLTQDFRPNALLLSLADRLTPALASNIAVAIRRLLTSVSASTMPWFIHDETTLIAKRAHDDAVFGEWLLGQLKSADIGVVNLTIEMEKFGYLLKDSEAKITPEKHDSDDVEEHLHTIFRFSLLHRGAEGSFPIPYDRESDGTKTLISLAPILYDLAHDSPPKAAFVDEIDASLHPKLLESLIRHFNCEIPLEKARGQLVFVTHETSLLDAEAKNAVLRRDQVYLTEKDNEGAAKLYSVAEFKERNNLNLRRRYLQGRYGALPSLGSFED